MKSSPIHVVSTFHYDVLYLKDYDEYLEQAMAIIDRALEILEAEPDYCFTIEQVILVREYFRRHHPLCGAKGLCYPIPRRGERKL